MLELDCHLTKDHQVVVHHDFSLDRTAHQIEFIRDMNYEVINCIVITIFFLNHVFVY